MANLTNQLAEVNKSLERMESQLEILKTIIPLKNLLPAWKHNVEETNNIHGVNA